MAPTSIMRNGLSSPIRGAMKPRPRSVLKQRPTALPMSPSAGGINTATFTSFALSSPSGGVKSPHVHFPPSAVLAATYATHSPRSYDRTSIAVSPNPLALPSWGDRVYSPSADAFKLGAPPTPFRALGFHLSTLNQASPLIADFDDPRSPKPQPASTKQPSGSSVRFAPFPVTPLVVSGARPRSQSLDKSYPRSPYPSSADFPSGSIESPMIADTEAGRPQQVGASRDWPQDKKSAAAAEMSRTRSLIANGRRNKKGLSLGSGGLRKSGAGNFISISSPLTQSFSTSTSVDDPSSLKRSNKPAPLQLGGTPESEKLSDDFWLSMSMQESNPDSASSEAMFTALEYPESAVLYEATQDAQLESATAPQILYAGADGVPLWSPGVPTRGAAARRIRESLLSPALTKQVRNVARKEITAPSPNDPFAAFPSFAAALEGGSLSYPAPVVSRG